MTLGTEIADLVGLQGCGSLYWAAMGFFVGDISSNDPASVEVWG